MLRLLFTPRTAVLGTASSIRAASAPGLRFYQTTPSPDSTYHITRTASQQYPIYLLTMNGGNLRKTRVKHIHGDVFQLRQDLIAELKIEKDEIEVNPLNNHIIIKGWHKDKIMEFFKSKNF